MIRQKHLIIFFLISAAGLKAFSQNTLIHVEDEEKQVLIGATVQLFSLPDSISYYSVTESNGTATFNKLADGLYAVMITYIGFQTLNKNIKVDAQNRRFNFRLSSESKTLAAVEVRAKKPLISQDGDKMIVDPEPLASTSTNALEVLETVPGLYVDQDGGVFMSNASPAQIYINGREQKMSSQDMAAVLRSLPPGSIQRIEVMRTPSSKYDASSTGGIVNIVLKKGVKLGRYGSVNIGMNQGIQGNQFGGFSLNNSMDKGTWYLNGNFNRNANEDNGNLTRSLSLGNTLFQTTKSESASNQANAGYGLSLDLTEKTILNYDGRLNWNNNLSESNNGSSIIAPEDNPIAKFNNLTTDNGQSLSLQQDFGLIYKLDTLDSVWETKAGYNFRDSESDQEYKTDFVLPAMNPLAGEGVRDHGRHFILLQSDLTYAFKNKTKLETGLKGTFQEYESNARFFTRSNGTLTPDTRRTNAYKYREFINAAYIQASRPLPGRLTLKAGLRLEHTNMQGNQSIPYDTSYVVSRVDLFPYIFISRPILKISDFEISGYLIYRRTIDRPGYQSLNPSIRYIDDLSFETGNPGLQPQFTHNFEANISYNETPIIAIGRNYTNGIISNVLYPSYERPEIVVRTYDNLGKSQETYFRLIAGIPPGKTYFFAAGGQYNLNDYNGIYYNEPLKYKRGSLRLFTFHALNLSPNTRLTLSGFLFLHGQQNFYELGEMGQMNLSLNQYFLGKKLQISLFARDVLKTMKVKYEINQGGIASYGQRYSDNRRIGIQMRYNFGFGKKKERQDFMQMMPEE